jgi:hypothetical protein
MIFKIAGLVIGFIFFSCSSSSQQSVSPKFDAPLLQKMKELEKTGNKEEIKIFGKCQESINDQMRKSIEQTGTRVESVMGNIFTAAANTVSLKQLAGLDFVIQLQLSTTSKPL